VRVEPDRHGAVPSRSETTLGCTPAWSSRCLSAAHQSRRQTRPFDGEARAEAGPDDRGRLRSAVAEEVGKAHGRSRRHGSQRLGEGPPHHYR
jgi:hypothetical protein